MTVRRETPCPGRARFGALAVAQIVDEDAAHPVLWPGHRREAVGQHPRHVLHERLAEALDVGLRLLACQRNHDVNALVTPSSLSLHALLSMASGDSSKSSEKRSRSLLLCSITPASAARRASNGTPQVDAVKIRHVEEVVTDIAAVIGIERVLQCLEVGQAVFVDDNDFAIEPCRIKLQTGESLGLPRHFCSPVVAIAREEPDGPAVDAREGEDAVAVELDLVAPFTRGQSQ